jgi:glucosylglycerol 3-phosphatase
MVLHAQSLSLDHELFSQTLATTENLLIIQDLDGVCMELVRDPITRQLDPDYVRATAAFDGHFYVLTNGEHVGKLGVQGIVERALGDPEWVKKERLYLPGLAGGGVQWQNRQGEIEHPGVSKAELDFLAAVPSQIEACLVRFFEKYPYVLSPVEQRRGIQAAVLDNLASPTANLNTLAGQLGDRSEIYRNLQWHVAQLMNDLLAKAARQGLNNAFFVHYAPNLGRDSDGSEILRWATPGDSGTTDFQFMLRGAIKEAGLLALLNRYYHQRTGEYPLGEGFNVRQAPRVHADLLELAIAKFDPQFMPLLVGVGDTVNSQVDGATGKARRGGSDRHFLQLIQDIGRHGNQGNLVVYVDSSQGEVKNRKPLTLETINGKPCVIEGPGDRRDTEEPLTINVAFPGGFRQYIDVFKRAACKRKALSTHLVM